MDPNECYGVWLAMDGNSLARYLQAYDLIDWLRSGGFEPEWDADAKEDFLMWVELNASYFS